jgi:hypothetical protein
MLAMRSRSGDDPGMSVEGRQEGRRWPGRSEIGTLLRHLAVIERAGEPLYRVDGARGYVEYEPEVDAFMDDLNLLGFTHPFDWPRWRVKGMAVQLDPGRLAAADLTDLVKLLTMHVRAERFNEGHWARALDDGWFAGILRRLAEIERLADRDPDAAEPLLADREGLARP